MSVIVIALLIGVCINGRAMTGKGLCYFCFLALFFIDCMGVEAVIGGIIFHNAFTHEKALL